MPAGQHADTAPVAATRPTPEQRHEMIAIAAYYLAEQRGFAPGGAEGDWLRAEAVVDRLIAAHILDRDTSREQGRRALRNALVFNQAVSGSASPDTDAGGRPAAHRAGQAVAGDEKALA